MIDHDGTLAARLQADADAILRVVAPAECPPFSATLVVPFHAIGMDTDIKPSIFGFSVTGFDNFAAWHFDDCTLVGRPVFALNPAQIIKAEYNESSALAAARDVAAHETAHAIARKFPDTIDDPKGFIDRVTAELTSASFEPLSPASHNPAWWRRYSMLIARMKAIAPKLAPLGHYARAGIAYGFCRGGEENDHGRSDADKWITAAQATPDFMVGPILEVVARPCPQFDALLNQFHPSTTTAPAVAAYSS